MKTYEVVFDESSDRGVYALSCVDNPAMEDMWVKLSKDEKENKKELPEEMQLSAIDEERRILLGAALIPDKPIYRNIDGDEFWITFSSDTIEKSAHAFLRNGFQNNSSENHQIKLEGVSVVESWLVDNPETDKSKQYGKTYPKGTWVTMMKVHNEEAWEKAKNGELNGFSIDGQFSLKQVQLNKDDMSEEAKKSLLDEIKAELKSFIGKKSEVKMGRLKLKDGKSIVEFEGDAPEVGMPVFGLSEEKDDRFPLPEGEHELEDGNMLHVDKNGLVAEAPVAEPENLEEVKEAITEMAKHFNSQFEKINTQLSAKDKEIEAKNAKIKELEAKLEKEPAAQKIVKTELAIKEPKTKKERLFNAISAQRN